MSAERSSIHPFPGFGLPFKHLWHPGTGRQVCGLRLEGCPVDALRAALERETSLLHEKELLLKEQEVLRTESDHQLLNDLQLVVSLLALQSRAAGSADVAMQLSTAANRVAMIERVHRRLYFRDATRTVELKKFLQELCQDYAGLAGSVMGRH
jgi:two-component sensor histidine kinase